MADDDPTVINPSDPRRSVMDALRRTTDPDATVVELRGAPPVQAARGASLGRYPLLGSLGAGGMGEVLEALDPDLGRRIAAKVIRGDTEARVLRKFVQEAQITGQLDHPNIVPVYELGLDDSGRVYFTMKKVRGQDLAAVLAEAAECGMRNAECGTATEPAGTEPWWKLAPILVKVCDAMEFAHSRGVIHRDLKPANIMVGAFGEVQVMDWGLAKVLDAGADDPAAERLALDLGGGSVAERAAAGGALRTMDGAIAGTPSYMPPEQANGQIDQLDERADIYALGAILYEMLALRPPYTGETARQILVQVVQANLELPSKTAPRHLREKVPWELERVVECAMAPAKADRYPTVAALRADLERFLTGQAVAAAQYTPWQLFRKWAARHRAAVAAAVSIAAVVVLATVVALVLVTRQKNIALAQKERAEVKEQEAQQARRKVAAKQQEVLARLADFESMADVRRVVELKAQFEALGPQGWKIAAMTAWIEQARKMRERLATHRQIVKKLKSQPSRNDTEEWQLQVVERLIPQVEALVEGIPEVEGWLRDKPWNEVRRQTLEREAAKWREAIEAIGRHPKYGGLRLAPQEGLVPLFPDPNSTLWEFVHLPSGTAPVRGGDGRWVITEQTGIVLVLVPGGTFQMGASDGDGDARPEEKPAHPVTLAPFFIGKHELTQGQWQRMTGKNPSRFKPPRKIGGQGAITLAHPVEAVSWYDCNRTLQRSGLLLPAEAQWEHAARAGTRTIWCNGNERSKVREAGNVADQALRQAGGRAAFESWNDGHAAHAPVGRFAPNAFGLHDCVGNVWEWCQDEYDDRAYRRRIDRQGVRKQPTAQALEGARARVSRGGGWSYAALDARSASRGRHSPGNRFGYLGARPGRLIERMTNDE